MGTYDLKRLEVAIQYIRRMAEGRNPVTNRPAPENDVLTNGNVNRCLKFVEEILTDVKGTGGIVGAAPRASKAPKPGVSSVFPYEILREYRYEEDRQISRFLGQLEGYLPEGQGMPVKATMITNWLRENGYLEKRMMEDIGKENSVPTKKGRELGLYDEKAGSYPNEYYRVFYNAQAQQFLIDNFRKILTETEELAGKRKEERREERRQQRAALRQGRKDAAAAGSPLKGWTGDLVENVAGQERFEDDPAFASLLSSAPAPQERPAAPFEDDPAFASLLSNIPQGQDRGFAGGMQSGDLSGFMGEGWENAEDGLPW